MIVQNQGLILERSGINEQLKYFGLNQEVLRSVAFAYYMASMDCTENDPPTYPGIHRWGRATRIFRDFVIPLGWVVENLMNLPLTIHPDGKLAVVIQSGDRNTGISGVIPSTRIPKGSCTKMLVNHNDFLQIDMFEGAIQNLDEDLGQRELWVLLISQSNKEIRMELSLPVNIDSAGNITAWSKRIILEPIEFDYTRTSLDAITEFAPEQDVIVSRRK